MPQATASGLDAPAMTDCNSLAGIGRAHGRAGAVVHLVADRLEDLTPMLRDLEHNRALRGGRRDRHEGSAPIRVPMRDFR